MRLVQFIQTESEGLNNLDVDDVDKWSIMKDSVLEEFISSA